MPETPWAVTLGRTTQKRALSSTYWATSLRMRAVATTRLRSGVRAMLSTVPTLTSRKRIVVWPASTPAALSRTISIVGPRSE